MARLNINELINVRGLKKAIENYSKVRGMTLEEISECLVFAINNFLAEISDKRKVKFKKDLLILYQEDRVDQDNVSQELNIPNKNHFNYLINQKITQQIKVVKIKHFEGNFDTKNLGLIEVKLVRAGKDFLIANYQDLEVYLNDKELIKRDRINVGDILKVLVKDYVKNGNEIRLIGTRKGTNFIHSLFCDLIPEIQEGTIEISQIAREEGIKTYIVVKAYNAFINPLKAVIGVNGSRIKEIKRYVPERIEILEWTPDFKNFVLKVFKENILTCHLVNDQAVLSLLRIGSPTFPELEISLLSKLFPNYQLTYKFQDRK